jgi:uncharacterized tellurite resistance protein B-like protein
MKDYQTGLLYLMHLLISADGVIDENEREVLTKIKQYEGIADDMLSKFEETLGKMSEKDIYQKGIELINQCNDEDKLQAFVHLYKMSEADGRVHVKEVRLLLYSIRSANVEFNQVVEKAGLVTY